MNSQWNTNWMWSVISDHSQFIYAHRLIDYTSIDRLFCEWSLLWVSGVPHQVNRIAKSPHQIRICHWIKFNVDFIRLRYAPRRTLPICTVLLLCFDSFDVIHHNNMPRRQSTDDTHTQFTGGSQWNRNLFAVRFCATHVRHTCTFYLKRRKWFRCFFHSWRNFSLVLSQLLFSFLIPLLVIEWLGIANCLVYGMNKIVCQFNLFECVKCTLEWHKNVSKYRVHPNRLSFKWNREVWVRGREGE